MSKRELIDRIRTLNPTAPGSFLAQFAEADLSQYLEHLRVATLPRMFSTHSGGREGAYEDPRQLAMTF